MALIKCRDCGEEVSKNAKACPKCGAAPRKKTSLFTWLVSIFFAFVFFGYITDSSSRSNQSTINSSNTQRPSVTASQDSSTPATTGTLRVDPPNPPPTSWRTTSSVDEITGEKSSYAASIRVKPRQRMGFPYGDTEAWLGVGCDGSSEWAYIGFSNSPNIPDGDTRDGHDYITARNRWDDAAGVSTFTQQWGSSFLHFQNDATVINKLMSSASYLIEINWYGEGNVLFEFPLNGSSAAIEQMRAMCI